VLKLQRCAMSAASSSVRGLRRGGTRALGGAPSAIAKRPVRCSRALANSSAMAD